MARRDVAVMPNYALKLARTASTTLAVGIQQASATARRMRVHQLIFGSEGTVADNPFLWTVDRVTADGSLAGGTSVTPNPFDAADAAAVSTALDTNITTNPTIGVRLMSVALNQRNTFRWEAAPGRELVSPATDNNGFAYQTPTSGAVAVTATIHYEE